MRELVTPRQLIRGFITENFLVEDFSDETSFRASGLVDSMGIAQLVTFLEVAFGVRIEDADLTPENLDSVASAAALVERKRGRTAA